MKACMLLLSLPALSALTACAPGPSASSSDPARPAMLHGVTYVHPWEISGQWQLVGGTGAEVLPQSPIEILIGGSNVEAISRCVQFDLKGPFGQVVGMRAKQSSPSAQ